MSKKLTSFLIIFLGVGTALTIVRVQTFAASKPYIALERDSSSGLFSLTVSDPNGIKEFSLLPQDKSPYGGALGNCVTIFKSNNIGFFSPDEFTPKMDATILDCQGNTIAIELPPLKDGVTRGTVVTAELTQIAPASTGAQTGKQNASSETKPKSNILANIQFPVKELGNCQSEFECTAYCDDANHATACLDFAQKNNLLTPDEIQQKEKLASIGTGPGGCTSQASCETYCNDVNRIDECVAFGEAHSLLVGKDLEDAKKIQSAIGAGKKLPGGCRGKKSCETYCNDSDHTDECLAFAEDTGFLSQQEIQQYKTFTDFRKKGETPGGCTTKTSCEAYCENPDNMEECLSFGEKTGFVSNEDAAMARKVLPLIKEGKTPGKCRTKGQCEAYCASEEHADECINFGLQAGMISQKDAEIIKKTGGKGPGGCHSKEQCQTYCEQNQKECASWAKDNGLEGEFSGGPGGPGGPGGGGGAGFSGPGGCKSQEECMAYCKANQEDEACKKMMQQFGGGGGAGFQGGPGSGGGNGQGFQGGPGGCKSQEECTTYCKDHQEECKNFSPPGGEQGNFQNGQGGFPGGQDGGKGGEQRNGFSECGIVTGAVAVYVCGVNGRDAPPGVETTYFNRCHAEQQGVQILHEGACGKQDCPDIADPVCANDGSSLTSDCHIEKHGGVKHKGVCTKEDFGGQNGGGGFLGGAGFAAPGAGFGGGPGGCKSQEECTAYCKDHPQECGGGPGTGGGGSLAPLQNQLENPQQIPPQILPQIPPPQNFSQTPLPSGQTSQDYCSSFASVPSCSYVGSPDSQNYKYCKQCFPDK